MNVAGILQLVSLVIQLCIVTLIVIGDKRNWDIPDFVYFVGMGMLAPIAIFGSMARWFL